MTLSVKLCHAVPWVDTPLAFVKSSRSRSDSGGVSAIPVKPPGTASRNTISPTVNTRRRSSFMPVSYSETTREPNLASGVWRQSTAVNSFLVGKARSSCYTYFVKKRNVTISLNADVARWARIKAAENDTSVSRMLAEQLEQQMARDTEYEQAQSRFLSKGGRRLRQDTSSYPKRDSLHER